MKPYIILLFIHVFQSNGLVQLKGVPTSDSPLLQKILQSVDAATSDEHLFHVTLKLLKSLCLCMRETLKYREKQFDGDDNSIEEDSTSDDGKVLDIYKRIYNHTCFNLKREVASNVRQTNVTDDDIFLDHTNCGKRITKNGNSNLESDLRIKNDTETSVRSKFKNILYKALRETKDYHKYKIRRYNLFGKAKSYVKSNSNHSIIVILTLHPNMKDAEFREKTRFIEEGLNKTLYSNSPIEVDIIDTKYDPKGKESEEYPIPETFSDCYLQSIYVFLIENEKNNRTKVFKILQKQDMVKVYIDVTTKRNHTDYSNICCKNHTINAICKNDSMTSLEMELPEAIDEEKINEKKIKAVNYQKSISKIKKLVRLYTKRSKSNIPNDNITEEIDSKENIYVNSKNTNKQSYTFVSKEPLKLSEVTQALLLINDVVNKQTTKMNLKMLQTDTTKLKDTHPKEPWFNVIFYNDTSTIQATQQSLNTVPLSARLSHTGVEIESIMQNISGVSGTAEHNKLRENWTIPMGANDVDSSIQEIFLKDEMFKNDANVTMKTPYITMLSNTLTTTEVEPNDKFKCNKNKYKSSNESYSPLNTKTEIVTESSTGDYKIDMNIESTISANMNTTTSNKIAVTVDSPNQSDKYDTKEDKLTFITEKYDPNLPKDISRSLFEANSTKSENILRSTTFKNVATMSLTNGMNKKNIESSTPFTKIPRFVSTEQLHSPNSIQTTSYLKSTNRISNKDLIQTYRVKDIADGSTTSFRITSKGSWSMKALGNDMDMTTKSVDESLPEWRIKEVHKIHYITSNETRPMKNINPVTHVANNKTAIGNTTTNAFLSQTKRTQAEDHIGIPYNYYLELNKEYPSNITLPSDAKDVVRLKLYTKDNHILTADGNETVTENSPGDINTPLMLPKNYNDSEPLTIDATTIICGSNDYIASSKLHNIANKNYITEVYEQNGDYKDKIKKRSSFKNRDQLQYTGFTSIYQGNLLAKSDINKVTENPEATTNSNVSKNRINTKSYIETLIKERIGVQAKTEMTDTKPFLNNNITTASKTLITQNTYANSDFKTTIFDTSTNSIQEFGTTSDLIDSSELSDIKKTSKRPSEYDFMDLLKLAKTINYVDFLGTTPMSTSLNKKKFSTKAISDKYDRAVTVKSSKNTWEILGRETTTEVSRNSISRNEELITQPTEMNSIVLEVKEPKVLTTFLQNHTYSNFDNYKKNNQSMAQKSRNLIDENVARPKVTSDDRKGTNYDLGARDNIIPDYISQSSTKFPFKMKVLNANTHPITSEVNYTSNSSKSKEGNVLLKKQSTPIDKNDINKLISPATITAINTQTKIIDKAILTTIKPTLFSFSRRNTTDHQTMLHHITKDNFTKITVTPVVIKDTYTKNADNITTVLEESELHKTIHLISYPNVNNKTSSTVETIRYNKLNISNERLCTMCAVSTLDNSTLNNLIKSNNKTKIFPKYLTQAAVNITPKATTIQVSVKKVGSDVIIGTNPGNILFASMNDNLVVHVLPKPEIENWTLNKQIYPLTTMISQKDADYITVTTKANLALEVSQPDNFLSSNLYTRDFKHNNLENIKDSEYETTDMANLGRVNNSSIQTSLPIVRTKLKNYDVKNNDTLAFASISKDKIYSNYIETNKIKISKEYQMNLPSVISNITDNLNASNGISLDETSTRYTAKQFEMKLNEANVFLDKLIKTTSNIKIDKGSVLREPDTVTFEPIMNTHATIKTSEYSPHSKIVAVTPVIYGKKLMDTTIASSATLTLPNITSHYSSKLQISKKKGKESFRIYPKDKYKSPISYKNSSAEIVTTHAVNPNLGTLLAKNISLAEYIASTISNSLNVNFVMKKVTTPYTNHKLPEITETEQTTPLQAYTTKSDIKIPKIIKLGDVDGFPKLENNINDLPLQHHVKNATVKTSFKKDINEPKNQINAANRIHKDKQNILHQYTITSNKESIQTWTNLPMNENYQHRLENNKGNAIADNNLNKVSIESQDNISNDSVITDILLKKYTQATLNTIKIEAPDSLVKTKIENLQNGILSAPSMSQTALQITTQSIFTNKITEIADVGSRRNFAKTDNQIKSVLIFKSNHTKNKYTEATKNKNRNNNLTTCIQDIIRTNDDLNNKFTGTLKKTTYTPVSNTPKQQSNCNITMHNAIPMQVSEKNTKLNEKTFNTTDRCDLATTIIPKQLENVTNKRQTLLHLISGISRYVENKSTTVQSNPAIKNKPVQNMYSEKKNNNSESTGIRSTISTPNDIATENNLQEQITSNKHSYSTKTYNQTAASGISSYTLRHGDKIISNLIVAKPKNIENVTEVMNLSIHLSPIQKYANIYNTETINPKYYTSNANENQISDNSNKEVALNIGKDASTISTINTITLENQTSPFTKVINENLTTNKSEVVHQNIDFSLDSHEDIKSTIILETSWPQIDTATTGETPMTSQMIESIYKNNVSNLANIPNTILYNITTVIPENNTKSELDRMSKYKYNNMNSRVENGARRTNNNPLTTSNLKAQLRPDSKIALPVHLQKSSTQTSLSQHKAQKTERNKNTNKIKTHVTTIHDTSTIISNMRIRAAKQNDLEITDTASTYPFENVVQINFTDLNNANISASNDSKISDKLISKMSDSIKANANVSNTMVTKFTTAELSDENNNTGQLTITNLGDTETIIVEHLPINQDNISLENEIISQQEKPISSHKDNAESKTLLFSKYAEKYIVESKNSQTLTPYPLSTTNLLTDIPTNEQLQKTTPSEANVSTICINEKGNQREVTTLAPVLLDWNIDYVLPNTTMRTPMNKTIPFNINTYSLIKDKPVDRAVESLYNYLHTINKYPHNNDYSTRQSSFPKEYPTIEIEGTSIDNSHSVADEETLQNYENNIMPFNNTDLVTKLYEEDIKKTEYEPNLAHLETIMILTGNENETSTAKLESTTKNYSLLVSHPTDYPSSANMTLTTFKEPEYADKIETYRPTENAKWTTELFDSLLNDIANDESTNTVESKLFTTPTKLYENIITKILTKNNLTLESAPYFINNLFIPNHRNTTIALQNKLRNNNFDTIFVPSKAVPPRDIIPKNHSYNSVTFPLFSINDYFSDKLLNKSYGLNTQYLDHPNTKQNIIKNTFEIPREYKPYNIGDSIQYMNTKSLRSKAPINNTNFKFPFMTTFNTLTPVNNEDQVVRSRMKVLVTSFLDKIRKGYLNQTTTPNGKTILPLLNDYKVLFNLNHDESNTMKPIMDKYIIKSNNQIKKDLDIYNGGFNMVRDSPVAITVTKNIKYNTYQPTTKEDLDLLYRHDFPIINTLLYRKVEEKPLKPQSRFSETSCVALRNLRSLYKNIDQFKTMLKAANCSDDFGPKYVLQTDSKHSPKTEVKNIYPATIELKSLHPAAKEPNNKNPPMPEVKKIQPAIVEPKNKHLTMAKLKNTHLVVIESKDNPKNNHPVMVVPKNKHLIKVVPKNKHPIMAELKNVHPATIIPKNNQPTVTEINKLHSPVIKPKNINHKTTHTNIYNLKPVINKNLKSLGSKKTYFFDSFEKTNLYPMKLSQSKPQYKSMKRIQVANKRKEIMTMSTKDFFSQRRFISQKNVKDAGNKYQRRLIYRPITSIPKYMILRPRFENHPNGYPVMETKGFVINNHDHSFDGDFSAYQPNSMFQRRGSVIRKPLPIIVTPLPPRMNILQKPFIQPVAIPRFRHKMESVNRGNRPLYEPKYKETTQKSIPRDYFKDSPLVEESDDDFSEFSNRRAEYQEETTAAVVLTTARRRRTIFFLSPTVPYYNRYF